MSIEKLREDVSQVINLNQTPIILNNSQWKAKGLPEGTPACIRPEGEMEVIYILDEVNDEDHIYAEAHELAHKLLNARGLIEIQTGYKDEIGYFKLSLNKLTNPLTQESYQAAFWLGFSGLGAFLIISQ